MIFLYIFLGLLVLFFIILVVIHHIVFYTPIKGQNNEYVFTEATLKYTSKEKVVALVDSIKAVPYEDAWIKSKDNKKLHAKVYRNEKSNKVAIMCHGYRGTSIRDFSGGARFLIDLGLNVVLIDERGHGESKGHSITFGRKEKYDILEWVKYAKTTFGEDKEIILVGISMGASSSIFASEYLNNIKVIADSPYNTIKEVLMQFMKVLKMPVKLLYPFIYLSSLIISRANITKENASRSVKNSNNKYLILHGEEDSLVPLPFAKKIYEDNPDKVKFVAFPKCEHGLAFIVDTEKYKKEIEEFIK